MGSTKEGSLEEEYHHHRSQAHCTVACACPPPVGGHQVIAFNYAGVAFMAAILLMVLVTWAVLSHYERKDEDMYVSKTCARRYHNDW